MNLQFFECSNDGCVFSSLQNIIAKDIPEEERGRLAEILKSLNLKKGQCWLKAGDTFEYIAFTLSGLLRFFYIDINGNDVTKNFCFENSIVLTPTVLTNKGSSYYIEALEDTSLMMADYSAFKKLTEENFFWLEIIKNEYEKALIYKENRERSFLLENATERYITFVNDYPNVDKRVKHKYIASYLGMTPVSLSRLRKKLTYVNDK